MGGTAAASAPVIGVDMEGVAAPDVAMAEEVLEVCFDIFGDMLFTVSAFGRTPCMSASGKLLKNCSANTFTWVTVGVGHGEPVASALIRGIAFSISSRIARMRLSDNFTSLMLCRDSNLRRRAFVFCRNLTSDTGSGPSAGGIGVCVTAASDDCGNGRLLPIPNILQWRLAEGRAFVVDMIALVFCDGLGALFVVFRKFATKIVCEKEKLAAPGCGVI